MPKIELRVDEQLKDAVMTKLSGHSPVMTLSALVKTLLLGWLNEEGAKPLVPIAGEATKPNPDDFRHKPAEPRQPRQVKSKPKTEPQPPTPPRLCVCGGVFHPVSGRCFRCSRKRGGP